MTQRKPSTSQNVVADTRPGARRVLLVGAHLDSVLVGPGHQRQRDRGRSPARDRAGRAQEIPGARGSLRILGRRRARAFSARAHTRRASIEAGSSGTSISTSWDRPPANGRSTREARSPRGGSRYFERRGLGATAVDIGGRSDHFPFEQIGIPTGGLFAGGYACYHRPCDRLESIDLAVFDQLARAAAFGIASFAPIRR